MNSEAIAELKKAGARLENGLWLKYIPPDKAAPHHRWGSELLLGYEHDPIAALAALRRSNN